MNIEFECECSELITVQTDDGASGDVVVPCADCGTRYAVSITELVGSDERL